MNGRKPITVGTDPSCSAPRHLSARATGYGCVCPEAIRAEEARKARKSAYEQQRWLKQRKGQSKPEPKPVKPVNLREADWVVVERALAGTVTWGRIKHPVDRVAVVEALAKTHAARTIAVRLNTSYNTITDLLKIAEVSRARAASPADDAESDEDVAA